VVGCGEVDTEVGGGVVVVTGAELVGVVSTSVRCDKIRGGNIGLGLLFGGLALVGIMPWL